MSWNEPRTWIIGEKLLKADLDAQVRDNLNYLKTNINLESAVELTIAAGEVTISRTHHTIDTEADAVTDDLVTIEGGEEGRVILIRPAAGTRTIVLKHNTGNIWSMSGYDVELDDADDYSILVYSGGKWTIMGGSGAGTVNTSGTPEANDIARFTDLDTIEGISYAELLAALGVLPAIDEDDMVSNLETKVPSQQSVKTFVDNLRTYVDAELSKVRGPDFDAGPVTDDNNTLICIELGGA